MQATDDKGVTTREHLESVEQQTGRRPEELDGPEIPEGLELTWSIFLELNAGRQSQSMISFSDIKAYCELTGQFLYNWQLDAIKRLDLIWMRIQHGHR